MIWIKTKCVYVSINLDQFFDTGSKPQREVLGLVQIKKNGTKEEMVKVRAWQTASLTAILAYHSKTGSAGVHSLNSALSPPENAFPNVIGNGGNMSLFSLEEVHTAF